MDKLKTIYHDTKKLGEIFCFANSKGRTQISIWNSSIGHYDTETYASVTGKVVVSENEYYTIKDGLLHSFDDVPAVMRNYSSINIGTVMDWYDHGIQHRENGPSMIDSRGSLFFLHGKHIDTIDEFLKESVLSDEEKLELVMLYG